MWAGTTGQESCLLKKAKRENLLQKPFISLKNLRTFPASQFYSAQTPSRSISVTPKTQKALSTRKSIAETMSWQQYVDEHLMCDIEGNTLTAAAILGIDGSVWAKSATFPQFKPEEIAAIMKDFDNPGTLAPTGLFLGGTKYMVIQGEPGAVIRGKKGSGGITVKKTSQALIIGIYEEPLTPGQCNIIVERLGDYLIEQGL